MRRHVHRWTEGSNPRLVPSGGEEPSCARCGGEIPPDGGYVSGRSPGERFCTKGCLRLGPARQPGLASEPRRLVVVGLDLSLRAAAAAKVTVPWDGDLEDVRTHIVGADLPNDASPEDVARRLQLIANKLADFCAGADVVYVEEYAFSARASRAHSIGEVGGAVKLRLFERLGKAPRPIPPATARKTMLQKLPRAEVKPFVVRNVRRLGAPADKWTDDQIDAFVILNHGVMLQGGTPLSFLGE